MGNSLQLPYEFWLDAFLDKTIVNVNVTSVVVVYEDKNTTLVEIMDYVAIYLLNHLRGSRTLFAI